MVTGSFAFAHQVGTFSQPGKGSRAQTQPVSESGSRTPRRMVSVRSLALHEVIAQRLLDDPDALIRRARETLVLMMERHPGAAPLLSEWDAILSRPASEVADTLVDPRQRSRELREVTPFAGILSPAERAEIDRRFAASERVTP